MADDRTLFNIASELAQTGLQTTEKLVNDPKTPLSDVKQVHQVMNELQTHMSSYLLPIFDKSSENNIADESSDSKPKLYIGCDLLEHAYVVRPLDTSTKVLANQFIKGINDSNKYTQNNVREKMWQLS